MDDELTEYANLPSRNDSESDFSDNELNVDDYESPSEDMEPTEGQSYYPYPGMHSKYLPTTDSVEQDIYEEDPSWETQHSNHRGGDGNVRPSFSNFENRNFHNTAGIKVKPGAFKNNPLNLPPQNLGPPPFISKPNSDIKVRHPTIQPPTSLHVRQPPLQTFSQSQNVKPVLGQPNLGHRVKEPNINFPTRSQPSPLKKEIGNIQKVTPNRFPNARGAPSVVHPVSQPNVVRPFNPQEIPNSRGPSQPPIGQNFRNKFQNIENSNIRAPSPVLQSVRPWKIQPSVPSSVIGGSDFHNSVLNNNPSKQVPAKLHPVPQQEASRSAQPFQNRQPVPPSIIGSAGRNDQSVFNQNAIKQKFQNLPSRESSPVTHPKFQQNTPKGQPWSAKQSIPPSIATNTFKNNSSINDQNNLNNQNFKNFNIPPPPLVPKPTKSNIEFTKSSSPLALRKISSVGKVTTEQETLTLDDGKEIPMTELYRSLLREKYFHLISKPSAKDYLPDGTFLLRPSTTHSEEKPLTLCLRYSGRVFVFSVEKRKNGCYSVGVEKEGEMQFSTVQEMISHYRNNPFYFEGVETYFVHPGTEPPSLNH